MTGLPEEIAQPTQENAEIPEAVSKTPQGLEAPEISPYVISFAKYNDSMCEISELNSNKAKKAIETFKTIGTKIRSKADFGKQAIDRIPVIYEGEYKKLFRGLSEDIDLKEIKLQQDARIFYFDIEPKRTLYVVAITQNHLETKQVRR